MARIEVQITLNASLEEVWKKFTTEKDLMNWYFASSDWHCPKATHDFTENGKFSFRMEAKDQSFGFDFSGVYTLILPLQTIEYTLDDERKVQIHFKKTANETQIIQIFEAETEKPDRITTKGLASHS